MMPRTAKYAKKKDVTIFEIFSRVYVDEELREVNRGYCVWQATGSQVVSSLGYAEAEFLVARLLVLARVYGFLVGVSKEGLRALAQMHREDFHECCGDTIGNLIERGFLREELIEGTLVVFPTEKLVINQKIPKIPKIGARV